MEQPRNLEKETETKMKRSQSIRLPGQGELFIEYDLDASPHTNHTCITEANGEYTIFVENMVIIFSPEAVKNKYKGKYPDEQDDS